MFLSPQDINISPSSLPDAALPSIFSVKQEAISITTSICFHLPYLPSCDFLRMNWPLLSKVNASTWIPDPKPFCPGIPHSHFVLPLFPSLLDHLCWHCINTFLLLPFLVFYWGITDRLYYLWFRCTINFSHFKRQLLSAVPLQLCFLFSAFHDSKTPRRRKNSAWHMDPVFHWF